MSDTFKKTGVKSETPEEVEFELRAQIGSMWSGGRLFIGMYTFLLASLAFSYFYLRSSNNGQLWRPNHVTAPIYYGYAIYALMVLMAILSGFGQKRLKSGAVDDWQVAAWTGVGCGLLALFLQIWEFTAVSFYPGSSGYASTFIGFAVMNIGTIAIGTYWLETAVARSHRMRKEIPGSNPELSSLPTARMFRANVASMTYFLGFVALGSTLFLAMFYLM
jgi:heme/copper-type cytochrome/quinol oxidase subunit 3